MSTAVVPLRLLPVFLCIPVCCFLRNPLSSSFPRMRSMCVRLPAEPSRRWRSSKTSGEMRWGWYGSCSRHVCAFVLFPRRAGEIGLVAAAVAGMIGFAASSSTFCKGHTALGDAFCSQGGLPSLRTPFGVAGLCVTSNEEPVVCCDWISRTVPWIAEKLRTASRGGHYNVDQH